MGTIVTDEVVSSSVLPSGGACTTACRPIEPPAPGRFSRMNTPLVCAASPIRDLADLIARAKADPGKYTFGSGGVGTGNHLAGELLKKLAGIDLLHVPFRGVAPALTALYAGDIDMLFASTVETVSHARDRRIRVLGVGSPQPIPELPDAPAMNAGW